MSTDDSVSQLSRGFPPVIGERPTVLILGSLPGQKSITEQQYYAQPRNVFWSIMAEICGARPALSYEGKLEALRAAGVALWDVLAAAKRPGSLDSAIVAASAEINDFKSLFARHPSIGMVCCNGKKAAELYTRRVLPTLPSLIMALPLVTLPSTSPAFASMPFEEKLARWRDTLEKLVRH